MCKVEGVELYWTRTGAHRTTPHHVLREYDFIQFTQGFFNNNTRTQFAREDVGLCFFYGSNVKKMKLSPAKTCLRDHFAQKDFKKSPPFRTSE